MAGSSGIDTVHSGLTVNLLDATHFRGGIEQVALMGSSNVNAIGNGLNNLLIGNAGMNVLNGAAGADTMRGLAGNDHYIVDNAGDIVDESVAGSGGIDTVHSGLTVNLLDTTHFRGGIEQVVLAGSGDVNAIGNGLNNLLIGNAGNNVINGVPAPTHARMGGNDHYIVDNAGDIVDESVAGSSGIDTVHSGLTVNLLDTAHFRGAIEQVGLMGSGNVNAIGNGLTTC